MRNRTSLFALPTLVMGVSCAKPVNTMPAPVSPMAEVQRYDLELPPDLEIRGVDFTATTYANVSGVPDGAVSSTVNGRAFVKVWAVHRTTREDFLVLYEDVAHRTRPVQIIRFVRGADRVRPDSTR